jgi:hypothetical protein
MLFPPTCGKKRRLSGLWKRIPFPALEEAATASVHAVGDGAKPHRASIAILVGGTATARRWRCSLARVRRYSRLRGCNDFKFHRVGVRHPEMPAELSGIHSEAWGWRYRQVYMALLFVVRASTVLAVSGGLQRHGTAASYHRERQIMAPGPGWQLQFPRCTRPQLADFAILQRGRVSGP